MHLVVANIEIHALPVKFIRAEVERYSKAADARDIVFNFVKFHIQ